MNNIDKIYEATSDPKGFAKGYLEYLTQVLQKMDHDAITVGLTGFDGGKLKPLCHLNIHAPSVKGEYGPVEDVHMIIDHLVGAYLIKTCQAEGSQS